MPTRRTILGLVSAAAGASLAGAATAGRGRDRADEHDAQIPTDAVTYVRNVEEVRGHLTSAATLLAAGRQEDAALHTGHGSDYFAAVLPPLRDEEPELATRLRGRLTAVTDRVENLDADGFESYVTGEVFPVLDEAVAAVVADDVRGTTAFDARVMDALAGRIAEEYTAAVTAAGEIELAGEYWDGRGFLTRIEARYDESAFDSGATGALSDLRTEMEGVEPPAAVRATVLRFRVAAVAAADLPSTTVDSRDEAVAYVRNAEEVRGHVRSSIELLDAGDESAGGLHAGHGSDYVMTLVPAVRQQDADLAATLRERLVALGDRAGATSPDEYEQFATSEVFPVLDEAVAAAVPAEYSGTSFNARVTIGLLERIEDEYTAAVTDEEVIKLYGEYWDARGFFERVRSRYDAMSEDLDEETRELVEPELDILEEELRTAAQPWDVANSIAPLIDDLGRAVDD